MYSILYIEENNNNKFQGRAHGAFETINIVSVVLFAVGMVLLLIELFVPGFGIFSGSVWRWFCASFFRPNRCWKRSSSWLPSALSDRADRRAKFKTRPISRSPLVLKDAKQEEGYVSGGDYSTSSAKPV